MKSERGFLLNKFLDKNNRTLNNTIIKENLRETVDNKEVSEVNLINHKRLIYELIGFVNREEDERYLMEI